MRRDLITAVSCMVAAAGVFASGAVLPFIIGVQVAPLGVTAAAGATTGTRSPSSNTSATSITWRP